MRDNKMRLCDIIDIKSAFMEKTDLSEEEIQTIIDDIPTAYDIDKVVEQLEEFFDNSTLNDVERAISAGLDSNSIDCIYNLEEREDD